MPYLGNEVAPLVQALEGKELKLDSDGDSSITADTDDRVDVKVGGSDIAHVTSTGLGVGTTSPSHELHITGSSDTRAIITSGGSGDAVMMFENASGNTWGHGLDLSSGNYVIGYNASGDPSLTSDGKVNIDTDGRLLVGKTTIGTATVGVEMRGDGLLLSTRDGDACSILRRNSDDGEVLRFQKDSSTVGSISTGPFRIFATGVNNGGWAFSDGAGILPMKNQGLADNNMDLGASSNRMDDIYAGNTSIIGTSDKNEKQDIASATAKELSVAKKLSALFKTFRWKDKVSEKGDKARTHSGIIAQDIQSVFSAEGLDASKYGLFCSNTWWEKEIKVDAVEADEEKGIEAKDAYTYMDIKEEKTDGYTEKTRLGVRYAELFSFIFSSIEARLTALESK